MIRRLTGHEPFQFMSLSSLSSLGPSDDGPTLKTVITGTLNAVVLSAQCSALPLRRGQTSLNIISTMDTPCLGPEGHKWAAFCEFKTDRVFYLGPGVLYIISWYIWTTLLEAHDF